MYVHQQRVRRQVTENDNPKTGKVKIPLNGDEIKGEGADLEGAFTFIGKRPPAPASWRAKDA
jgi:hypothetical protein